MALYHTSLYVPKQLKLPNGQWTLEYSGHARTATQNDRYGNLPLLRFIDTRQCTLIEVEVQNGKIQKLVYRTNLDETRDMTLAIIPLTKGWYVKSVWANRKDDNHRTLDVSRYDRS